MIFGASPWTRRCILFWRTVRGRLIEKSEGVTTVPMKLVYKIKCMGLTRAWSKSQPVANGYHQKQKMDFEEVTPR